MKRVLSFLAALALCVVPAFADALDPGEFPVETGGIGPLGIALIAAAVIISAGILIRAVRRIRRRKEEEKKP